MKRSKIKEIEKWFNSENRKPLIVWGARQVGKTHLLKNEFASGFKDFLYIDLIKDDEARKYFDTTCDAKKYLEYIETRFNKKISNFCYYMPFITLFYFITNKMLVFKLFLYIYFCMQTLYVHKK